jgi:hypothetical protein
MPMARRKDSLRQEIEQFRVQLVNLRPIAEVSSEDVSLVTSIRDWTGPVSGKSVEEFFT